MKFLRNILILLAATVLTLSFQSCRKRSPNGQLDGQWQILTVEDKTTGEVVSPYPKHYICLNLHVVNLTITGRDITISGNMNYSKENSTVSFDYPLSQYNVSGRDPRSFGMFSPQITFKVVRLDSKQLVIESDASVVSCRRF